MEFQRIGDHSYFCARNIKGKEKDIFLDLEGSRLASADERYMSLWFASQQEKIFLSQTPFLLKYKERFYIVSSKKLTVGAKVSQKLAEITNFFRDTHRGKKKSYNIDVVTQIDRTNLAVLKVYDVEGAPRATVAMPDLVAGASLETRVASPPYSDPYTLLTEKAYQQGLEGEYCAHDEKRESETCFYFDVRSQELRLVARSELPKVKKSDPAAFSKAVSRYLAFLTSEYGEEKVAHIEHLFGVDLREMAAGREPLTPELVYRINMGTSLVEIQDVQRLWTTLQKAAQGEPGKKLITALESLVPAFELRGLMRHLGKEPAKLTIADLRVWVDGTKNSGREIDRVMDLYAMEQSDRDRMYSGRKIFESIASDYTTAEWGKRKLEIDLQELAQIADEHHYDEKRPISEAQREAAFNERLAHVVCKKEMVHSHPKEGLRVGMLLPGRPHPDGQRQWYIVTGCTRTVYGKCSITLEPASAQGTLSRILLHRSTFSLGDAASARNDLNPLSGPGYEGHELAANYEDAFVDSCTIPAWVGYAVWAEQLLNQGQASKEVRKRLDQATKQLIHTLKKPYAPKSFLQLIRSHDYLIMDLLYSGVWTNKLSLSEKTDLVSFLYNCSQHAMGSEDEQVRDAIFLATLLDRFPSKSNRIFAEELRTFARQMTKGEKPPDAEAQIAHLDIVKQLRALQETEGADVLAEWSRVLLTHAKALGEHPSQKHKQDVKIVGHSLGGALSQISMARYTSGKERIPLKAMKAWTFDAPGIHAEDCEAFSTFGNKHWEMMQALGSKLAIASSHEKGDITSMFGEQHLGSVSNEEELNKQQRWLSFENSLYAVHPKTKTRSLRDSPTVHGTRFQTRMSEEDVSRNQISPVEQYQFDTVESEKDWARFNEIWKMLPGTPLSDLSPRSAESLRKRLGIPIRALRPSFFGDPNNPYEKYADSRGVFAVDINGVRSIAAAA